MGLRIQNNIAAMNAHRQLGIADAGMNKSLERLSSGYRINRAADDAAGLAISQSFRADIASFKVASRNTSEASSLLQVAEGGLDQIGNMLTRMKELATQAASANSGTNIDKINAEYSQLKLEIDRIANSTEYADSALLDGTFGASLTGALGDASANMGIIDDNVQWDLTAATDLKTKF
ncbi:MAG: flagellin, partial [Deltaproteobacteria bacterium]|nr:flagellin [Deltaproteobacteria bacterium]